MELEERTCVCGKAFRCLPISSQQYHSLACRPKDKEYQASWRSRMRRKNESTAISTTSEKKSSWPGIQSIDALSKKDRENTLSAHDSIPSTNVALLKDGSKLNNECLRTHTMLNIFENEIEKTREQSTDAAWETLNTGKNENSTDETIVNHPNESGGDESILSDIESDYDRQISPIGRSIEKSSNLNTIKEIHVQRSQAYSERLAAVSLQSQNLVDQSISQLKELMKLSVSTLHSQEAKVRDPQMVNAGVNSAKAITELLKIKLEAAKLK